MIKRCKLCIILFLGTSLLSLIINPSQAYAKDVCATVKIEILQEMTFERQAFEARMKITNGLDSSALENVRIDISLVDEEGDEKTDLFFITLTSKTGLSGDPDGSGRVDSGGSAEIYWLLIPAKEAAGNTPLGKRYFAGATLGYTMMGEQNTIIVAPDMIHVLPQPYLKLDYFLPDQVYADDPFTDAQESAIPFNLGVRIHNIGLGAANKLKIDSGQPRIVENTLGLLVDFKIIGSSVNDEPVTNSLLINFGDLEPESCGIGRWQMISTLTGNFIEFDATLTHADYLGGEMTSLVDYNIGAHFLLHDILIDLPGRDTIRDFLTRDLKIYSSEPFYDTNDTSDSGPYSDANESESYFDTNKREIIPAAEDLSSDFTYTGSVKDYDLCLEMQGSAFTTNPYIYIKREDLTQGNLYIVRVLRSDGKTLPEDNYWIDQYSNDNGHTWTHYFNIFDTSIEPIHDPSYCLYYEEIDDTEPPLTDVIIGEPRVGDPNTTEEPVYVNPNTTFTFMASDVPEKGASGIKDIRVTLDSEEDSPLYILFMFSQRMDAGEGFHTLSYRSIDNMGNEEPVNTRDVFLDLSPPVVEDVSILPQTIMPGAPPEIAAEREARIILQITDESGIIDLQIDIDPDHNFDTPQRRIKERLPSGKNETRWNGRGNTQSILPPGVYHLRIKAADLLGHVTTLEGYSITISSHVSEGPIPKEGQELGRMRLFKVAPTEATDPKDQINPAIDQNGALVWQDYRNGNWDIYKFDGFQVEQVTTDPGAQEKPAISGQVIVWQDNRNGDWDIYYKNGEEEETGIILPEDQINPHISGNQIVFEENGNIFLHAIGGATEQITYHIRDQVLPRIDQDIIVWQDSRYGDPLIYAYDINDETEIQITPVDEENHTRHLSPSVSGDYILWTDNRSGNYDIYQYRITDESTQRLTFGTDDQTGPCVNGNHFVYIDHMAGNRDIAFGNTLSFISERVISDPYRQENPSLAGEGPYTIVWQDNRSGHWEIYRGVIEGDDLRIKIHEGLNLVALPFEKLPKSQNASELYSILYEENGIERLLQYNITADSYHLIDEPGKEFTIKPNGGFALYGTREGIISVSDVGDQGGIDLQAGFNQIGFAAVPAGFTAYDLIDSLGAMSIKMIQKFSGKDQRFLTINISSEGRRIGSNFPIYAGDGINIVMRRAISGWRPGRL